MERYVLDSCAILSYLQAENGAEQVLSLLQEARDGGTEMNMTVVNFGEVLYILERKAGIEFPGRPAHPIIRGDPPTGPAGSPCQSPPSHVL